MSSDLATDPDASVAQLFSAAGRADPYPYYAALRESAPVHPLAPGKLLVSRYADVARVLRDPVFHSEDPQWADRDWPSWRDHPAGASLFAEMVNTNGHQHRLLRSAFGTVFTPRLVAELAPAVDRLAAGAVTGLAERARDRQVIDFMTDLAFPLPISVIGELLGVPVEDRQWFRPRLETFTRAIESDMTGPWLARADSAVVEVHHYLRALVNRHTNEPSTDLLSGLLTLLDGNEELTEHDLLANLTLLYTAGYETTSNALGNGLAILLERPWLLAELRAHPDRATGFTEEILRFDSSIQITTRWASEDTFIGATSVPCYTHVMALVGSANRDPEHFPEPDRFLPRRHEDPRSARPLSFGIGPHFCLGANLARLEISAALRLLPAVFTDITPAGEARRRGPGLRGFTRMPLRMTLRG